MLFDAVIDSLHTFLSIHRNTEPCDLLFLRKIGSRESGSNMSWSLVCPASRGIGFQLARHLLETTKIPVVATTRNDVRSVKKSILEDLNVDSNRLIVLQVDVTGEFNAFS